MKSSFSKVVLSLILISFLPLASYGASGGAPTSSGTTTITDEVDLLLGDITVRDDMHMMISFNQSIVPEAVRVRITKQSDGSNIKVDKITGVVNTPEDVLVALTDVFEEGATYTITIMSAISENGVVIKEGADALKEFTTPIPLKKSLVVFNAPPNPNAVIASGATISSGATTVTPAKTATGGNATTSPAKTATELPLTGMNPLLLLIVAGILALIFVSRRKA